MRAIIMTLQPIPVHAADPPSNFNAILSTVRRSNLNGVYDVHTNMIHYPSTMQPTHVRIEQVTDSTPPPENESTLLPRLDPKVARNFTVTDTYMETPPSGVNPGAYEPSPAPNFLSDFQGLGAVSDDIKDLLPPECRAAFDKALGEELDWKAKWGNEAEAGHRRMPIIDAAIVPYSKIS